MLPGREEDGTDFKSRQAKSARNYRFRIALTDQVASFTGQQ
jgi:hypothetical protein